MSTEDIKNNSLGLIHSLLKGPFALPVLLGLMVYGWSKLGIDQIERVKELLPLLNSTLGMTIGAMVVISYIGSLLGPLAHNLITALNGIKEQVKNLSDLISQQHHEIRQMSCEIQQSVKHLEQLFEDQ